MLRRTLAAAVLVGLALAAVSAQAPQAQPPQSMKGVVLKGKAPVSNEILKVTLPRPQHADLPNGLHLIVLEDRRLPQVSFQIVVPGAGGYFDPPDHPGLASFAASMMAEGTKTRTSQQIAQQLETMASSVNVGAGMSGDPATMSGSTLSENLDATLDLAADILLNPSFPVEELNRFKTRTKAMLLQQRSIPAYLGMEMFNRVVFGGHPGARLMSTPAAVDKTTEVALAEFHRARYVPDFAVIGVVGDISMAEAKEKFAARFGAWKKAGVPRPVVVDPAPIGPAMVHLVNRPGSAQSSLVVGTQAISRTSPDYDIMTLVNAVIGGGPTGRLFLNLREEKGWTYGAYSNVSAGRYRGPWMASSEVKMDVTDGAITETLREIARLRDEAVPDKEFMDKKRQLVASFALSLETPAAILANYVTSHLYGLPADYWDRMPDRIMAVTKEQVQASAKKYFDPPRLHIVVVGDGAKIGDGLKKFGTVETYDTEGKRIGS